VSHLQSKKIPTAGITYSGDLEYQHIIFNVVYAPQAALFSANTNFSNPSPVYDI